MTHPPPPRADHHQHLFSPAAADLLGLPAPLVADDLIALLDDAGIERALLLSVAYFYGSPKRTLTDEYARVRAENDWTFAEARRHPSRLVAFCGFNPLRDYALEEIARCAAVHGARGIKLHLGNSDVQLDQPAHVARLADVFRAANEHGMAILIHLRASHSQNRPYGADSAKTFLDILPHAPDVPVQVAHLAGSGPGYADPPAQEAMSVLAGAVAYGYPGTANLWFDVASVADHSLTPTDRAAMAAVLRQVSPTRVLYGTDAALGDNLRPRDAWAAFRTLPLTNDEFRQIAANLAPYFAEN